MTGSRNGQGAADTSVGAPAAVGGLPGPVVHLRAGMIAETVSCVIFVPVDVVKERLQQRLRGGVAHGPHVATDSARSGKL